MIAFAGGGDGNAIVSVKVVTDEDVAPPASLAPTSVELEAERVRAAVTLALDAAMPAMIEKITEQVLLALRR